MSTHDPKKLLEAQLRAHNKKIVAMQLQALTKVLDDRRERGAQVRREVLEQLDRVQQIFGK